MAGPVRGVGVGAAVLALLIAGTGTAAAAGDTAQGKALFLSRCGLCHSGAPGDGEAGMGPPLAGVVGRRAASAPGFGYSKALKASGLVWTPANLNRFLKSPRTAVPGTTMPVAVTSDQDRADLIAYLATTKP
jgi:cytochrome c